MWYILPNFVIKIRIRNIKCGFLRGTNIFGSHKMRVGWEVLTNKIFTNAVTGIFLVGDIPAFVAREGDEVVLTCPVNTPGRPNIFVLLQIFFVYKYFPQNAVTTTLWSGTATPAKCTSTAPSRSSAMQRAPWWTGGLNFSLDFPITGSTHRIILQQLQISTQSVCHFSILSCRIEQFSWLWFSGVLICLK